MRYVLLFCALLLPAFGEDRFYRFSVDQDRLGGAVDFSFLNHPLTPADRLFVRNGHFYRVGTDLKPNTGDDERVRLFGVNMAFGANFPAEADAVRIAKRIRRLGVNLVRLHHMDTSPDRNPEDARSILTTGAYPTLNPVSVARLRAFLSALKAEGIYVNLNLHVGYVFRPSVDDIPALPGGMPMPTLGKPLHIFYPRMIEFQVQFTRKVIEALSLKDDPVLGMVEIDNESSMLEAWQRGNLDRYALGDYKAELEKQWSAFLAKKSGLSEGATLVGFKEAASEKRIDYWLLFLAECDRNYLRRMLGAVRESVDRFVPVAGTQMGYGGLLNLDSHQDLDYQDNHFYIDHHNFPNQAWDARDWRIRDSSAVGTGLAAYLNMAAAREAGKPYTVSEFNQPWPNRHAAESDPTLAAFGAFQDWDSIMHFAYEHGRSWDNMVPSGFNINGDWTKFPGIGQSAWLFRTAAVRPGKAPVTIPVSAALQLRAGREKRIGNIAAALTAAAGFDPAIALVHPIALAKGEGRALSKVEVASPYKSDTGELCYDREKKLFLIDAPRAAGVFGFVGTAKTTAGAMDLELSPSGRGFAAVLATALDGRNLKDSRRIVLSIPGYTLGTQRGTEPARPQRMVPYAGAQDWWTLEPEPGSGKPSANRNGGASPVWMERVECFLTLRSSAKQMAVYPLDGAGARMEPLGAGAVERTKGGFRIHLQADGQAMAPWYEITGK